MFLKNLHLLLEKKENLFDWCENFHFGYLYFDNNS